MDLSSSHSPPPPPLPPPTDVENDEPADETLDEDDDSLPFEERNIIAEREQANPSLQELVLQNVLPLLPVRSLRRFRSVSSHWKYHISAPIFAHQQTISNRLFSGIFCCDPDADSPSFYVPFGPAAAHDIPDGILGFLPYGKRHIVASCGGLLCCSRHPNLPGREYVVCNPATLRWTELPCSTEAHDGVVLDFTPSLINLHCDYRLICTFQPSDEHVRRFAVFSSCDGRWRVTSHVIAHSAPELLSIHGIAVGEKAYWRTTAGSILFYDPISDASAVFSVPNVAQSGWAVWQLGEFHRRLCCVSYSTEEGLVRVHVMGDDIRMNRRRWVLVRQIQMSASVDVRPLMLQGCGWEAVLLMEGCVVTEYAVGTEEGRMLCELPVPFGEVLPYMSTLAYVKEF